MLNVGKLDSELLKKIVFDKIVYKSDEVLVRPNVGEDCATVDFGQFDCVISTDPITAAVNQIGSLAIHITCNDIASNGVKPLGIMIAAMLPVGTSEADVENIMTQAGKTAEELEVEIIGGHTEITSAVNKPVIVSTAIGKSLHKNKKTIKAGDVILMTKRAGLEGIGIIAEDCREKLEEFLTEEEIREARSYLRDISVVKEGIIGGQNGAIAMHDVTEGGILGAVWEMCKAANVGAILSEKKIKVDELTKKIASKFDIDYLRLISSGCMIMIAAKDKKEKLMEEVSAAGIEISEIGRIEPKEKGIKLSKSDNVIEIKPPDSDELYAVIK